MKRPLLTAALLLSPAPPTPTALCEVQGHYAPVTWPGWAPPERRFRRIILDLKPGCPDHGLARVKFINRATGRTVPESGYYVLTPQAAHLVFPLGLPGRVSMNTWDAYWLAQSGRPYRVPLERQ